ncbi:MAG: hypothetical protein LBT58_03990 [Endomicrobium sp.]|jgi:hypothetical protein|nr:hypothetical protein [Endomicrobium sp.]
MTIFPETAGPFNLSLDLGVEGPNGPSIVGLLGRTKLEKGSFFKDVPSWIVHGEFIGIEAKESLIRRP